MNLIVFIEQFALISIWAFCVVCKSFTYTLNKYLRFIWLVAKYPYTFVYMKTFKTLKIDEKLHKELKIYSSVSGENMSNFAEGVIMAALIENNHKFSQKPKSIKVKSK